MRKTLLTFCGLLAASFGFTQVVLDAHDKRDYYMNTITVEELKEHLYYLAADEFEGRETSKPGQKKAAAFLESYYNQQGLKFSVKKKKTKFYNRYVIERKNI